MTFRRSFLKWPGGKFRLLNSLLQHLPQAECFVEPFVGAGSVFLNVDCEEYWINDFNRDLISLYHHLKKYQNHFLQDAQKLFHPSFNTPVHYYALRKQFNESKLSGERAKLFLYLNRHGYNGLCRYNSDGIYNVPFGRNESPYFPLKEMHHYLTKALKVRLFHGDFRKLMIKSLSHPQAVVYCDPPYAPLSATANFTKYAGNEFGLKDQKDLAELARKIANNGGVVVISNHDLDHVRELYNGAELYTLKAQRMINCKSDKRTPANELIAVFAGR